MTHHELRAQFPILNQQIDGQLLCYLDTAATSQKPLAVLKAMDNYYQQTNANVHRAAHQLSTRATVQYEAVRGQVKSLLNAIRAEEIIFTHGTTEAINLVAHGLTHQLVAGDIILVDTAAHHANLVPWQQLALRTGAVVKAIPLTEERRLDEAAFDILLQHKPTIVALGHVSNALGTLNPVARLVSKAKAAGAITLVDGAQAVAHLQVDVQQLDCDFYVFSGHKMYGPTGVGILYGKYSQLDRLHPMLTGGEMIKTVSFAATEFGILPNRLEAGTPPIAEVIGLGAAIEFIGELTTFDAKNHEREVFTYLRERLIAVDGITLYAAFADNIGAIAFNVTHEHHQDVGILLDQQQIAVRCGHHCAMPLMQTLEIEGCCRASVGIYTNKADIDRFILALESVIELLTG